MASTSLTRTKSTPTNQYKWTWSGWVKLSDISDANGGGNQLVYNDYTDTSNRATIYFEGNDTLVVVDRVSNVNVLNYASNRRFRDANAWYHIVVSHDRTLSTPETKIYVNGVEETSFTSSTNPSQNGTTYFNQSGQTTLIGKYGGGAEYYDGYMSHVHFIDGTIYQASDFGQFNSDGVWTPKTSPSVTYGTNGFFLKFENSGSMGTDSSGNGNNFTVNGTLTQTVDTPSNVYATLNPLGSTVPPATVAYTLSTGNTTAQYTDGSNANFTPASLATMSGKWYAECKVSADGSFGGDWPEIGVLYADNIADIQQTNFGAHNTGVLVNTASIVSNGNKYDFGTASTSYFSGFTNNDIISMAMDCDTGKIWFGVNGTWINSGDPANGTGENATATTNKFLTFYSRWYQPSTNTLIKWNFGNGYFGTTAVSSAGSNGNGSIFEYDVPTGYYALNTKNLATYG
jgi:hypothetical protein